jgi:hypothetical protein
VDNTPSVMGENDKDEQGFEPNRVYSEEVKLKRVVLRDY